MKLLKSNDIPAISVSTFTGFPEIMGGRVKTLHPKIYAGILHRRDNPKDVEQLANADSKTIDLVIVNLYPFKETVAKPNVTEADAIENIDIGGPTMIRAAAKNFESVVILVDSADYSSLSKQLDSFNGATELNFRKNCAAKAFAQSADYDVAISRYFTPAKSETPADFPKTLELHFSHKMNLRYGENPHQAGALYESPAYSEPSLLRAEVLAGKELSYNNYNDLDACLDMLLEFNEPFAGVVKHTNPCGAAIGKTIGEAYQAAYESDPLSAYGSIIGLNREVNLEAAQLLHETPFVECILAPSFSKDALELLSKKKARRLLALPEIAKGKSRGLHNYRFIQGGLLAQSADDAEVKANELKIVTKKAPTKSEISDLLFAWKVVKHTISNAIVLAKNGATVGIGMGQTSRVDSSFMAVKRAGERAKGAVMASDAFFPMPDGLEVAVDAGVAAVIQPGGSKGDEDVIKAADKAKVAMVFTGIRHFKH
ncbi:MAG: bifunctional phosphoribosylaminoimidazolecarboxamide formyltransferase/IMP cyclohydrolase, partial [Candidatus Zixiibacteriota bacterium]